MGGASHADALLRRPLASTFIDSPVIFKSRCARRHALGASPVAGHAPAAMFEAVVWTFDTSDGSCILFPMNSPVLKTIRSTLRYLCFLAHIAVLSPTLAPMVASASIVEIGPDQLPNVIRECALVRQTLETTNAKRLIARYANRRGYSDSRYIALLVKNDADALYTLAMEEFENRGQSRAHLQNALMLFDSASLRGHARAAEMAKNAAELLSVREQARARLRMSRLAGTRRNTLLSIGLPKTCDGATRDAQRLADLTLLRQSIQLYVADHGDLPSGIPVGSPTELCGAIDVDCEGRLAILQHIQPYIVAMPRDPLIRERSGIGTRYFISRTGNGTLVLSAPDAEIHTITVNEKQ